MSSPASGACNCVGFIGSGLGGGIGYLSGVMGLVSDSLVSARLITAKGDLIEVSESSNPDLFWAIRGAGTNFGIITSATYKLSEPVNNGEVFYADLLFPASAKTDYFNAMQTFNDDMPAELGFSSAMFWDATSNEVSSGVSLLNPSSKRSANSITQRRKSCLRSYTRVLKRKLVKNLRPSSTSTRSPRVSRTSNSAKSRMSCS